MNSNFDRKCKVVYISIIFTLFLCVRVFFFVYVYILPGTVTISTRQNTDIYADARIFSILSWLNE